MEIQEIQKQGTPLTAMTATLIEVCDELMRHVGEVKAADKSTPANHWAGILNRILDTRCQIMAVRAAEEKQPKLKKP